MFIGGIKNQPGQLSQVPEFHEGAEGVGGVWGGIESGK